MSITPDMLSINNVAAKLGLSVHQLRRWELMFGLEIKRGRGQQRQYRDEDLSVLERIKELVDQGWPTSQIRPQLEAEGLVSPKLIGATPAPGNPEVLQESIIGLRNFTERRFIEISKQIDELRQLLISVTLKNELSADKASPWQPTASEYMPAPKIQPPQEITIGPQISIDPPNSNMYGNNPGLIGRPQPGPNLPRQENRTSFEPSIAGTGSSPSNEAVSRSMSALDSMFKERDPGISSGSSSAIGSGTSFTKTPIIPPPAPGESSESQAEVVAAPAPVSTPAPTPAPTPVRYSTIPPLPESTSDITERDPAATGEPNAVSSDLSLSSRSDFDLDSNSEETRPASPSYDATAVDVEALSEAQISGDQISAAGSDLHASAPASGSVSSNFAIPPLPPNPFKSSASATGSSSLGYESSKSSPLDLNALFTPGQNTGADQASFAPAAPAQLPDNDDDEETIDEMIVPIPIPTQAADTDEAAPQQPIQLTPGPQVNFGPNVSAPTPQATPQRVDDNFGLGEVTDQNYLTVLGRALDLIGWTDEQADSYSLKTFGVPHWDELGRSQAEKLVAHLIVLLKEQMG